jgi:hypothetical protein
VHLGLLLPELDYFLLETEDLILINSFLSKAISRFLHLFIDMPLERCVEDDSKQEVKVLPLDPADLLVDLDHSLAGILVQDLHHQVVQHRSQLVLAVGEHALSGELVLQPRVEITHLLLDVLVDKVQFLVADCGRLLLGGAGSVWGFEGGRQPRVGILHLSHFVRQLRLQATQFLLESLPHIPFTQDGLSVQRLQIGNVLDNCLTLLTRTVDVELLQARRLVQSIQKVFINLRGAMPTLMGLLERSMALRFLRQSREGTLEILLP